jgi:hypothetical protein
LRSFYHSQMVLIFVVHHVILSSDNLGSSLGLVLIFSHEWSSHLKVQFFLWNILQVIIRELVVLSGLGSTNVVSQSSGLSGVGGVSCLNISDLCSLKRLLVGNHS